MIETIQHNGAAIVGTDSKMGRQAWLSLASAVAEAVADRRNDYVVIMFDVHRSKASGQAECAEVIRRWSTIKPIVGHLRKASGCGDVVFACTATSTGKFVETRSQAAALAGKG